MEDLVPFIFQFPPTKNFLSRAAMLIDQWTILPSAKIPRLSAPKSWTLYRCRCVHACGSSDHASLRILFPVLHNNAHAHQLRFRCVHKACQKRASRSSDACGFTIILGWLSLDSAPSAADPRQVTTGHAGEPFHHQSLQSGASTIMLTEKSFSSK